MAFDFKKEYKELYLPKTKPEIVTVPMTNYIAVRGQGDPNEAGGAYQNAIQVLYAIAYTLKMSYKTDHNAHVRQRSTKQNKDSQPCHYSEVRGTQ